MVQVAAGDSPGGAGRLARHHAVASELAALSDDELVALVGDGTELGQGIGGRHARVVIADAPVFVKWLALTDVERRPEHFHSSADLFGLPPGCHYGIGSPGFGAWRQLLANQIVTGWVATGSINSFPLLHHWRILDIPAFDGPLVPELADVGRTVELWHGSPAVRRRIEAIAMSTASLVLFQEHIPQTLPAWLSTELTRGPEAATAAIETVDTTLRTDVAAMNRRGMFHFDAHLDNIRTDGEQLYLTDFGLAAPTAFELTTAETAFLIANSSHDLCHSITRFVDWLVTTSTDVADWNERDERIRAYANGVVPEGLLPAAAAVISRYAPVAVVINDFYRELHLHDRTTPYPTLAATRACATAGLTLP